MELCSKCADKSCTGYDSMITECEDFRAETNADRIRNMTDEELDKFLGEVQWDVANYCGGVTQKQEYPIPEQKESYALDAAACRAGVK